MAKRIDLYRGRDPRDVPAYTLGEAAWYLQLPEATVRSWVVGRPYPTAEGARHSPRIVPPAGVDPVRLSFRNLAEIHVLGAIRRTHGVSLRVVRRTVRYLKRELASEHPLVDKQMLTDGASLFVEHLGELIDAGKVRAIGASNFKADRLAEALSVSAKNGLPRYETLQPWYNLYDRGMFEGPLADLCRSEQLGVIPYFSLASGFLTGKYRGEADLAGSARAYRVKGMMDERGSRILAALDAVAAEQQATPAQIALAWLRGHGIAAPIASATSLAQLAELARSVQIDLDADQLARLDTASDGFSDKPTGPSGPPRRD